MKIMAWNLENFGPDGWWGMPYGSPMILRTLYPTAAANPVVDVFGVIEVFNRSRTSGPPGTPLPARSGGAVASLKLLKDLEAKNNATTTWKLVPPLSLGEGMRDEAVSVYYNENKVTFEGPNGWYEGANGIGVSRPINPLQQTVNYPAPWQNLVAGPTYYAPRVRFYKRIGNQNRVNEITFPDDAHRRPCMVRFLEYGRNLPVDIFFFHTSPPFRMDPDLPTNPALRACRYLSELPEISARVRPNVHATVVIGDFNVNANRPLRWQTAFGPLTALGYRSLVPTGPGPPPVPTTVHNRPGVEVPPDPIPEPICDTYYTGRWSIDNALWSPAALPVQGHALDLTRGTAQWPSFMEENMTQINRLPVGGARWIRFTATENWYQMRLRSDHVPIYIEV